MNTVEVETEVGGRKYRVTIGYSMQPGYRGLREPGTGVPLEPDAQPHIEFIQAHARLRNCLVPVPLDLINDDVLDQLEDRLLDQEACNARPNS
jgi:hypothetical protein